MQIDSKSPDRKKQNMKMILPDPDMPFETVKNLAKEKARETGADPMLLSWHSGKTREYWPKYECGTVHGEPWNVYAESRGCNLTVSVNDGECVFYFLLI